MKRVIPGPMFDPHRSFATFNLDRGNDFAFATAKAVAESPGQVYNPLFLYGQPDAGKTHLLHAIGQTVLESEPSANIAFLTARQISDEYLQALQANRIPAFRKKYQAYDLLLLDDVEFLAGQERLQEEFFHLFLQMIYGHTQIVMACHCSATRCLPPKILALEIRLVSRFEWGQTADLTPEPYPHGRVRRAATAALIRAHP